jgi:sortase A
MVLSRRRCDVAHRKGFRRSARVHPAKTSDRRWQRALGVLLERTAWAVGVVCLATWGALYIDGAAGARHELERFALLQAAALREPSAPELRLWDPERISAWREALREPAPPPLAVLRIAKIGLEVAVLPGTDDLTLNRAVGHIEDTVVPGTDGNSGIAGHRDGSSEA